MPGGQRQLKLPSPSEIQTPLLRHWQKKLRELRINKNNYMKLKRKTKLTGLGTQASQI